MIMQAWKHVICGLLTIIFFISFNIFLFGNAVDNTFLNPDFYPPIIEEANISGEILTTDNQEVANAINEEALEFVASTVNYLKGNTNHIEYNMNENNLVKIVEGLMESQNSEDSPNGMNLGNLDGLGEFGNSLITMGIKSEIKSMIMEAERDLREMRSYISLISGLVWGAFIVMILCLVGITLIIWNLKGIFFKLGLMLSIITIIPLIIGLITKIAISPTMMETLMSGSGEAEIAAMLGKMFTSIIGPFINQILIWLLVFFIIGVILFVVHFFLPKNKKKEIKKPKENK
jgi:hypothetical protein